MSYEPFAAPVLQFVGVTPEELVANYRGSYQRSDVEVMEIASVRGGGGFFFNDGSHNNLSRVLLEPHGLLGWRLFVRDQDTAVYGVALWICQRSLKRVMNKDALSNPATIAGVIWKDTLRLAPEVAPMGLLWKQWSPHVVYSVLDGENFVLPGPGLEDLPPEDQLPAAPGSSHHH